jgi:hypothetical protein
MKKSKEYSAITMTSDSEDTSLERLAGHLTRTDIPAVELLGQLGLYMPSKHLARVLFFYEIYKLMLETHGVICEFGVRYGQIMNLMCSLRSIFEPFNRHRRVIGFDTFQGLKGVCDKDGPEGVCLEGDFSVASAYENTLEAILACQEDLNPINHIRRFELVKGDARETVPAWFAKHPEIIVSLAIFDFDLFQPTLVALETIKPRLFKGSVLVFDELCDDVHPGETLAVMEVLGLSNLRIKRMPMVSRVSYVVVE